MIALVLALVLALDLLKCREMLQSRRGKWTERKVADLIPLSSSSILSALSLFMEVRQVLKLFVYSLPMAKRARQVSLRGFVIIADLTSRSAFCIRAFYGSRKRTEKRQTRLAFTRFSTRNPASESFERPREAR
jgi:hypothetical protein